MGPLAANRSPSDDLPADVDRGSALLAVPD
jgi:hypothetical protein